MKEEKSKLRIIVKNEFLYLRIIKKIQENDERKIIKKERKKREE